MIQSMTAYARHTEEGSWGAATWEIRSVNHRYLDIYFKLPEHCRDIEPLAREKIQTKLHRGKIEVFLKLQFPENTPQSLDLNEEPLLQWISLTEQLLQQYPFLTPPRTSEVLSWPGILQSKHFEVQTVYPELMQGLETALSEIEIVRKREGMALSAYLLDHLNAIEIQLSPLRSKIPEMIEKQRQNWQMRFREANIIVDNNRLEQEMLTLSQKLDVTEELNRLEIHIQETRRLLHQGGVIGRRLDFLMQELNREANTLTSKSIDPSVSHAAVEVKVLIEQMREQIQNIE